LNQLLQLINEAGLLPPQFTACPDIEKGGAEFPCLPMLLSLLHALKVTMNTFGCVSFELECI